MVTTCAWMVFSRALKYISNIHVVFVNPQWDSLGNYFCFETPFDDIKHAKQFVEKHNKGIWQYKNYCWWGPFMVINITELTFISSWRYGREKTPFKIYFESIGRIDFTCTVFPIFPTRSNNSLFEKSKHNFKQIWNFRKTRVSNNNTLFRFGNQIVCVQEVWLYVSKR